MDDASKQFRRQLVNDALTFIRKIEAVETLTTGITLPDLLKRLFVMHLDFKQLDCSKPEADDLLNTFFNLIREVEWELDLASQPS